MGEDAVKERLLSVLLMNNAFRTATTISKDCRSSSALCIYLPVKNEFAIKPQGFSSCEPLATRG